MDAARAARLIRFVAAALLAAAPSLAFAFGPLGHEIVAEVAARELAPATRAEVERLLGDRASPALRDAAMWADELRSQPGQGGTAPLHYINLPDDTCEFVPQRDCRRGRCVVGALEQHVLTLADRARGDAERAQALRWVVHLVADLHQPMHVGRRSDRGGNEFQLRLGERGTNLHAVWDSGLLWQSGRRRGRAWRAVEYAQTLHARGRPSAQLAWSADAPLLWARESCAIMRNAYPDSRRIGDEYVDAHLPTLERRLAVAGWRLAALLDAVVAGQ